MSVTTTSTASTAAVVRTAEMITVLASLTCGVCGRMEMCSSCNAGPTPGQCQRPAGSCSSCLDRQRAFYQDAQQD